MCTYKRGHVPLSRQLEHARVVEWSEPPLVSRFERLNSLLQPGYFPFRRRARRWIRQRLAEGETFDVALQVVPVAMRYPSPAAGLGIPFYIGSRRGEPGLASRLHCGRGRHRLGTSGSEGSTRCGCGVIPRCDTPTRPRMP